MFYFLYTLKIVNRQFYCIIMRSHFSRTHKEKGSGRALGLDSFFRDDLCFFIIYFIVFYLFWLAFYFRILILYTIDFNVRINKDIIITLYYSGSIRVKFINKNVFIITHDCDLERSSLVIHWLQIPIRFYIDRYG